MYSSMAANGKAAPDQPDLSHLTPEERKIIAEVMNRQMQDEIVNNVTLSQNQSKQNHEQPKKLITQESLKIQPTQSNPVFRAAPQKNPTLGTSTINPLNQVTSLVKRELVNTGLLDQEMCEICKKVKFADGLGNLCQKCQKRSCVRCSIQVQTNSTQINSANSDPSKISWFCNLCYQRQPKLTATNQVWNTITSDSVSQKQNQQNSSSETGKHDKIIDGLIGAFNSALNPLSFQQTQTQPNLLNNYSLNDLENTNVMNQNYSTSNYEFLVPAHAEDSLAFQSNYYDFQNSGAFGAKSISYSAFQGQDLSKLSMNLPQHRIDSFNLHQRYDVESSRPHATQQPVIFNRSASVYNQANLDYQLFPQSMRRDLRSSYNIESGSELQYRRSSRRNRMHHLSLSSSEGDETGFADNYGPDIEYVLPNSEFLSDYLISNFPHSSIAKQNQNLRFNTRVSRLDRIVSMQTSGNYPPACWTLSKDNQHLIANIVFELPPLSQRGMASNDLCQYLGFIINPDPRGFGAIIKHVEPGSMADIVGGLQINDLILEWGKTSFRGLNPDQINSLLNISRNETLIRIVAERDLESSYRHPNFNTINAYSSEENRQRLIDLVQSSGMTSTRDYDMQKDVQSFSKMSSATSPRIQLKLDLDRINARLYVTVISAQDLHQPKGRCNAYCQLRLLSDGGSRNTRNSRVITESNNPRWCESFTFEASSSQELLKNDLEVTIWDVDRALDKSAFIGEVTINLSMADLNESIFWYPLQSDKPIDYESEAPTPIDPYGSSSKQTPTRTGNLFNSSLASTSRDAVGSEMELGPIGMRFRKQRYEADALCSPYIHQPIKSGNTWDYGNASIEDPRYLTEEGEDDALGDLSEMSNVSDFSKMSYQSGPSYRDLEFPVHLRGSTIPDYRVGRYSESEFGEQNLKSGNESICSGSVVTTSGTTSVIGPTGSLDSGNKRVSHQHSRGGPTDDLDKDQHDRRASATGVHSHRHKYDKTSDGIRKRRSSFGQKFSTVLGLNRKSSSTSNLEKKSRTSFQRSEEVLPSHIRPTTERTGTSGYTAPGSVSASGGFGGISSGTGGHLRTTSICNPPNQNLQNGPSQIRSKHSVILQRQISAGSADMPTDSGLQSSIEGTNASGEAHVGEFVEGLGPGQLVGRQVLGMPSLGEIQLSFVDRKGRLEVEVIRARGLQQKSSARVLPQPYVKLHLLEGKQSVEKLRTTNIPGRTLDPLYQQQFSFNTAYHGKILQVSVWGDFGRVEKKVFMGMCEIVLDDLDISSIVFGWYKLFGMIASNIHHHQSQQTSSR